jgi:hypothetical protein
MRLWLWAIGLAIPPLLGPGAAFACPLCGDAAGGPSGGIEALALPLLVAGGVGFVLFRPTRPGR